MNKRVILHIIEWAVAVAALAYLVWRLATYDDYASLWAALQQMGWTQWTALVVCVLLMPVNMALEAWRWYSLMNEGINELTSEGIKELTSERIKELKSEGINELTNEGINELTSERLTFREAQRQVYYSKLAGLITPWRLGEYPARGLLISSEATNDQALWAKVLSMGAVGSATMTAAIVLAGVVALVFSPQVLAHLGDSYLYALVAVFVVLGGLMLLMPKALRKYAEVNQDLMLRSTMQSFVRLACWCVQLALVLFSLGALGDLGILGILGNCAVYYLLVTITPNVPVVEVGVRGAWAIFVFGSVQAGLAGVLLWVINTLLPCAIWPFLQKSKRKFV